MGDVDNSAVSGGLQLNIVNFGYLTGEHVGIAATWFGTSFVSKANNDDYIGLGGMLFGPLLSTSSASSEFDFDLKPMVGFGTGSARVNGYSTSSSMSFVFGLGGAVRWNCGNRISLSVGADYYHSKPDDVDLSSLAILFGINYRFK